ncbi:hypothetical protein MNBD_ALPHA07-672 [hydrothermal vent metagenome]|uniref:Uncharacterized protein n=1 Tax=hydrothermal vent metagenome TaxID=652676 RepID=A0A3B0ST65_9ZZZZ
MISLGPLLVIGFFVLVSAALYQAWAVRHIKRPLSLHKVTRRSLDNPLLGMEATDLRMFSAALRSNARLTDQHDNSWPWLKPAIKRPGT